MEKKPCKAQVVLTKDEVDALKQFCDENLAIGTVIIDQITTSSMGNYTWVMVKDLPDTRTDISDNS